MKDSIGNLVRLECRYYKQNDFFKSAYIRIFNVYLDQDISSNNK